MNNRRNTDFNDYEEKMKSAQVQGRVKTVMKLPKTKVNF